MTTRRQLLGHGVAALWCMSACVPRAGAQSPRPLRVAVAANFKQTLERLGQAFGAGRAKLIVSSGASGLLFSQVMQGAPFDLFFSADAERPLQLEQRKLIVPGTRFTYAKGKLVFWRPGAGPLASLDAALRSPTLKTLSIANPQLAPYGSAAKQVLERRKLWNAPPFRIVQGESLGQAYQFVATGNADAGFISLAQVHESAGHPMRAMAADIVHVDVSLHSPIEQQVVLLASAREKHTAREFLNFVRSEAGRKVIVAAGYN